MSVKHILYCLLILVGRMLYAQEETPQFTAQREIDKTVKLPGTPEAQAFTKYGNTPVNMYTGTPDISIPIFTLKGQELQMPVTLTYDASGIPVSKVASTVGLGWNLNAGGMVTRKTNGFPDRSTGSYKKVYDPETQELINSFSDLTTLPMTSDDPALLNKYVTMVNDYGFSHIDLEADTFNFNVNGLSGTIGIDYATPNHDAYCLEHPDILVDYVLLGNTIAEWIITDKNGIEYRFAKTEETIGFYLLFRR